ncbi:MAG: hypothetical protein K0S22_1426 [Oscillospiraceae bacterium]|nr:hypothetical protein [Oscillospiraceae bacterium]
MEKIKRILKDKSGSGFPLIIAVTLSLMIVFTGISEYFRLTIVAQGVRDAVQTAVISTVNDNYDDVYHGVREGYSGAYQPIAEDFEESIDYGDIYDREVDIRNAPFASGDQASSRFEADSTIMLEVPVSFGGKLLPPMTIKVKTSAGYTPRF